MMTDKPVTSPDSRASGAAEPSRFHPIANLFPLMEGDALAALVADIGANGLRELIVVHDGMILDGRNRWRAAVKAGLMPADGPIYAGKHMLHDGYREFGSENEDGDDPLAWVISKNLQRRHLTESQRAMVAAGIEGFSHGGARDGARDQTELLEPDPDSTRRLDRDAAAELMAVSPRSVANAAKVEREGVPELSDAVRRGAVAVSAASEIADLPHEEQKRIVEAADPKVFAAVAKEQRAKRQAEKKRRRKDRELTLAGRQAALPERKYGVLLADPEWKFAVRSEETGQDRAAANHYPVSETALIAARPVGTIAADDCVLFLWATTPMLVQALEVMAAWGFAYKTHFIWDKNALGTGFWNRSQHELLLLGTRGSPPAPAMGEQWASVQIAESARHSEKPDWQYLMIEAYFPNLPKIELNARAARAGWDRWGLEAPQIEAERPDTGKERASVTASELTEWKMLGAIEAGVRVDGPLLRDLQGRDLVAVLIAGVGADRVLTVKGRERLASLSLRVTAASSDDGGVRVAKESQAKASEDNGATVPGQRKSPADGMTGEASRPASGRTDAATDDDGRDSRERPAPDFNDDPGFRYDAALAALGDRRGKLSQDAAADYLSMGRAAGRSAAQLSQDLGHPKGTIKTWLNRLGLTTPMQPADGETADV